ncbi:MAG: MBL fold metallo-hydrolase [Lachnospiraceae bacterium]
MVKVTYIYHSGFLVELEEAVCLFDYYKEEIPEHDQNKPLYVFVSHRHKDHFNPVIFELAKTHSTVYYILASNIPKRRIPEEITPIVMSENEKIQVGSCQIRTLHSTDCGVAFIVEYKGYKIYHAGDLNWWHWNEESDQYNEKMKDDFRREIDKLKDEEFDIAFLTLDPRQKDKYDLGLDYFMQTTHTKWACPMHCWENYSICTKIKEEKKTELYRDRLATLKGKGQVFQLGTG